MRRTLALVCLLGAAAAIAEPSRIVVAPAGDCAGEERDLATNLLPKPAAAADAVPTLPAATHLTPTQVAGGTPLAAMAPPPSPPAFPGPGACDDPGSGCSTGKLLEDPDPGSGCGFPGSPCP